MTIKAIRGFNDILPPETNRWRLIEDRARETFQAFGYAEVRLPILERTEVFTRSIGEETDIVEKEMYTFEDRNGDLLTLRPEATASIARAYIEHKMYASEPVAQLYCIGPMFRYERPQKGRSRQFHQINVEVFGVSHPMMDAEVMAMLMHYLFSLGIKGCDLQINSLGCPSCRVHYKEDLQTFLRGHIAQLCPDCQRRMEINPLRAFDCKIPGCQDVTSQAPLMDRYLCRDCADHFAAVKSHLESLNVAYTVNPRMVRGLDYYTRTTFEALAEGLGAQNAVAAGGRYDDLIEALGGPSTPGIGFAIGMERLLLLLAEESSRHGPSVFVAALGTAAQKKAFELSYRLKQAGVTTLFDYHDRSLKAQMRRANKFSASYVLILGEEELQRGKAIFRDMKEKRQEEIPLTSAFREIVNRVSGRTSR